MWWKSHTPDILAVARSRDLIARVRSCSPQWICGTVVSTGGRGIRWSGSELSVMKNCEPEATATHARTLSARSSRRRARPSMRENFCMDRTCVARELMVHEAAN